MTIPNDALDRLPPQPYAAVRQLVRTGDLALCCGTSGFSQAIRWATKSPWSHIALLVRAPEVDQVLALESVEKLGVRAVPFDRFCTEDSDHHRPYPGKILVARHAAFEGLIDADRLTAMICFAIDRFGAPFNPSEMTKIALRIAFGRLGRPMPAPLRPDDEYICSEYVAACYERVGITIPWDGRGFIAPAEFAAAEPVTAIAQVATQRHPIPA